MNIKRVILVMLTMMLAIVTLTIVNEDNHSYVLHSVDDCCSITVVHHDVSDTYEITYNDYNTNASDVQIETRLVDVDALIDIYQDYCYTHHQ